MSLAFEVGHYAIPACTAIRDILGTGRPTIPTCAIVKFIWTLAACVLMGRISMMIVVFVGGAVVVSATHISFAGVSKGN